LGPTQPVGRPPSRHRVRWWWIAGGVAVVVVGLGVVSAVAGNRESKASWGSVQDELEEEGFSADEAQCVVERLQADDDEVPDIDEAGSAALFLGASVECQGLMPASSASCVFEQSGLLDDEGTMRELVAAEAALDAAGREAIAEASLVCQGATEAVAACVTDAMRREFGQDVFEGTRLELAPEDQQRLAAVTAECAAADS
jgi:hypothetical protein